MARSQPVNEALTAALAPYAHAEAVLLGVTSALGVPPGETLDPTEYPVRGFFLRASADVFAFYAVTPGRFVVFEMNASGDSLTLAFPVSRIRRVVEETRGGEVAVTVELDADRRVTQVTGEYLEGDVAGQDPNTRGGRVQSTQVETFAVYRIAAQLPDAGDDDSGTSEADSLWDFALALRNVLGE